MYKRIFISTYLGTYCLLVRNELFLVSFNNQNLIFLGYEDSIYLLNAFPDISADSVGLELASHTTSLGINLVEKYYI